MLLRGPFKPLHEENRMKNEGNVEVARKLFYEKPNKNLVFLLRNRFMWMNEYIDPETGVGAEVGCGQGFGKEVIQAKSYVLTDFNNYDWLDVKNVDALNTPFDDNSFDFLIASNMMHHLPSPAQFLQEARRILKPGGLLLIQDVNCSLLMRIMLNLMRIEGYSYEIDIFDPSVIATDPDDLWSGNNAIPNLLFDDIDRFHKETPYFKMVRSTFSECFTYLASGGVTAKTFSIPLPYFVLNFLKAVDDILTKAFPKVFALQRQVVLELID